MSSLGRESWPWLGTQPRNQEGAENERRYFVMHPDQRRPKMDIWWGSRVELSRDD